MNRRSLILALSVVALTVVVLALFWSSGGPEAVDDRAFAYPDAERIARITVADRNGNLADLRRGGPTGWTVNGQPANTNVVKNLLQAVTKVEVRSLPTSQAIPTMVKGLASGGILVRLFDEAGQRLRGYYIGGGAGGEYGTVAIMEGSDNPYVVHLPMWSGNLRHRFNLIGDEWRSKRYFQVDPSRVEHLEIDYPKQQEQSFRLQRTEDGFAVMPLAGPARRPRPVSSGTAEGVLSRYENYYVSRYENQDAETIAAARRQLPFAAIRVKERDRAEQTMRLYPRYGTDDATLIAYRAFINDGNDWVLLAPETTAPLLVGYASF